MMAAGPRRRYDRLLLAARLSLAWEKFWPCLWPAVGVTALFIAVALFDLLPMLPFWLHSLVLAAFALALGYTLRGVVAGDFSVAHATARRRLERDSGLRHRPLTTLEDELTGGRGDPQAESLWRAHLMRVAKTLSRLRVNLPSPGMTRRDPYGVRAVILLMVIAGGMVGGGDALARLERALVPRLDMASNGSWSLEIWITPPAYTGLAPVFLTDGAAGADSARKIAAAAGRAKKEPDSATDAQPARSAAVITIPVGSTLLAQARHTDGAPDLSIGPRRTVFTALSGPAAGNDDAAEGYRTELVFEPGDAGAERLDVMLGGRPLAAWTVRIVDDRAPEAEFTAPPKAAGRSQLQIEFEARDDYGLESVQAVIRHPEGRSIPGGDDSIRFNLPGRGLGTPKVTGSNLRDFTAHPWAGTPVKLHLQALDARGQSGSSDVVDVVLPQRTFNHPVARAIIEARKRLNTPDAEVLAEVVTTLDDLASRPKHFFDDIVVFLSLSFAQGRLAHDGSEAAVASVQKLLWDTALRIEDGEFAIADQRLREIQRQLMEAMQQKADPAELERLMDELQQALDKYMAALAEHLQKQGLQDIPTNPATQTLESGDLQRMIDEAREMARTGAVEAAKRMLDELNRMLDNIRNGAQMARPQGDAGKARAAMDALRKLSRRQQQLLDETFRRAQREQSGQQGAMPGPQGQPQQSRPGQQGRRDGEQPGGEGQGPGAGKMADDQDALRRELGRLMLQMDELLGSIPPSLGKAERAMRGATGSLRDGDAPGAVPQQTEALNQLRQATDNMAEQMSRRFSGAVGMVPGQQGRSRLPGRDPFGRREGGGRGPSVDTGDVKVPSRMEMLRAREIMNELRRRSGDRRRPQPELDYIDRLLRRF